MHGPMENLKSNYDIFSLGCHMPTNQKICDESHKSLAQILYTIFKPFFPKNIFQNCHKCDVKNIFLTPTCKKVKL